ncbi:MAG: tagaturonate reductase [Synergistaceae bacterium]|nr:tagaturonate reductase [Synergistaceae bacterium]
MKLINETISKPARAVKILQFGEGNFLRAFVDHMVDIANEKGVFDGGIAIVKPIPFGNLDMLKAQDCVYTVILRGKQGGETVSQKRTVTSVVKAIDAYSQYEDYAALERLPELRFVVSNTTEAGITYDENDDYSLAPPNSYPGKLTKFLYERYQAFSGDKDKGLIILPVELIEKNGAKLRECCLRLSGRWSLPDGFRDWLMNDNIFCSTLVDRIVAGYPKDDADAIKTELGYEDKLIVTGEPFALWVIECETPELVQKAGREFPLGKAGLPVVFTDNLEPYRERKVRILNGAHTSTVAAAYLAGLDTVGELMNDELLRKLIERNVYAELAPFVPLPAEEVKAFADSVMERFNNPFIVHNLLSISLNSISKFKARVWPSIRDAFEKTGKLPESLCFSLAALMAFYSGDINENGKLAAKRGDDTYEIMDAAAVIRFFADNHTLPADEFAAALLKRTDIWGDDFVNTKIPGLAEKVGGYLHDIRENGIRAAVTNLLK